MKTLKDVVIDIKSEMSYDEAQITIVRSLNNGTFSINGGLAESYEVLELKAALLKAMDAMDKLKEFEKNLK